MKKIPLCIDLDGTLIYSDVLYESALLLFKRKPFLILILIYLLIFKGKAALKHWIAIQVDLDISLLPYNQDLINWLRKQHNIGRSLVLCTAADYSIAKSISNHLGFFDVVMASDGMINLSGQTKAKALVDKFGDKGFDYAGNSTPDLEVWMHARKAIVVNATSRLLSYAESLTEVECVFEANNDTKFVWAKALRIHQWLKNSLLFVPMLAGHQLADVAAWTSLLFAFFAFSLCASSVYILNDLLDLDNDRQHPRKRKRPFASGALPIFKGVFVCLLLFIFSCVVGAHVGIAFFQCLMLYFLLTLIYSFKIKQLVLLDCVTLAILYTLRIVAGSASIDSALSFWLLAFSVFLFLSLAFIKRFAELQVQLLSTKHRTHGRGYFTDDAPLIQMFGIASGFLSVLVLALYLNSPEVQRLYDQREWVWGTVPVMVFWVSWMWLRAHRGEMNDDPLMFAVKDKVSLIAGVFFAAFLLLGAVHL